jgi:hypothetical protein
MMRGPYFSENGGIPGIDGLIPMNRRNLMALSAKIGADTDVNRRN